MQEVWKDVLGYEGLYQVSDLGRVKAFESRTMMPCGGIRINHEKIMSPSKDTNGYFFIGLCKNKVRKKISVHRLVWEAFNGKTNLQIDHIIEGNKTDNRLCNLQAVTQRQNISKYILTTNKTSKYIGVSWRKDINKWTAYININRKRKQ